MICENCINSDYIQTGTCYCFVPHCRKGIDELAKRYAELNTAMHTRHVTELEVAEYRMIKSELQLKKVSTNA